jgi:HAD superfamily hydrolase (TIGR01509 family)
MLPDALLFDLDGVLVDTYEVWFHLLNDVARRLGHAAVGRDLYRASWGQGIEEDVRRFYPGRSIPEINALYEKHYPDHLERLKVMEGAGAALAGWAQPKAVVTNSPFAIGSRALEVAGLRVHFRDVVGCDMVARSKPAPDGVLLACEKLGVAPARALMIGDSRFDEGAARAAGVPFVWFRSFAELRIG